MYSGDAAFIIIRSRASSSLSCIIFIHLNINVSFVVLLVVVLAIVGSRGSSSITTWFSFTIHYY